MTALVLAYSGVSKGETAKPNLLRWDWNGIFRENKEPKANTMGLLVR